MKNKSLKRLTSHIKIFATFICLNLNTTLVKAQLTSSNAQYFLNKYLINPAFAGETEGLNININYLRQWVNFPNAPNMQFITADYKLDKIGIGISFSNEKAGSLQRTKTSATYAYHLPLVDDDKLLNFGFSVGITNEHVNYNDLNGDLSDVELSNFNNKGAMIDSDFGMAYTSKTFSLEATLPNLRSFIKKQSDDNNLDKSKFYVAASYKINTGTNINWLVLEPRIAFRSIKSYTNIFDAGVNLNFTDKLFLMGMYHSIKRVSFGAGINYNTYLNIMGFYTTETSALQSNTNGSFEISVKANLFNRLTYTKKRFNTSKFLL